jgi:hypothetical protein
LDGRNWKYTKGVMENGGGNVGHQYEHAMTQLNFEPSNFKRIQLFVAFELRVGI